ncbi:hypothetical protein BDR26DRAFT_849310, partial [Obelidium mucronatum]
MHEADGNDSEEDCGNPGTVSYESDSMDSSDFTIYDALEYADLLRAGGVEAAMYSGGDVDSILSNGGVGSCSGSSCAVSASAKSIKVVSPTGTKRLWQGDSDDLDEEYEEVEESDHEEIQCESNIAVEEEEGDDGDDDEIDDASFGVNNVVDGSVFLDEGLYLFAFRHYYLSSFRFQSRRRRFMSCWAWSPSVLVLQLLPLLSTRLNFWFKMLPVFPRTTCHVQLLDPRLKLPRWSHRLVNESVLS